MSTLYLSLGSNLGNRAELLERAIVEINRRIGPIVARSSFHETEPVGFVSEHAFLNACVRVETNLTPFACLHETQAIEKDMGRVAKTTVKDGQPVYHDRCIDIDLLMYDEVRISTPELVLPHPRMNERAFVLDPLAEVLDRQVT